MRGRGSSIGRMVPFRSLTEALLSLSRNENRVDVAALGPYHPILARLIPDWGKVGALGVESVVILAEAVLRLTGLVGQGCGCLVALEDLQNADTKTLAVVEYLIDNLDRQPTALIGTIRAQSCSALRLARCASRRGAAILLELDRLSRDDLGKLAAACLGVDATDVLDSAADLLWVGSGGNPYQAEELLTGLIDSGLLVYEGKRWREGDRPLTRLPAMLADRLTRGLDLLVPRARELLLVAATVGVRFPVALVLAATGLDDQDQFGALRREIAGQLVVADEQNPGWHAFRHRLIREALLNSLPSAERAALAWKVANATHTVYPGLPGQWCELTATLLLQAGNPGAAGRLLIKAGQRALAQAAAGSAVALLDRALELLPAGDHTARADAVGTLLYALVESGLVDRALACAEIIDQIGGELHPCQRVRLHTRLAWAAVIAGEFTLGAAQVDAARTMLGPNAALKDTAPVDVVAAELVLEVAGQNRLVAAEALARRAAAAAEAVPLPVVTCKALQLLGTLTRQRDPDEATVLLERAYAVAVQHDLPIRKIHALVRLGVDDALREGSLGRLERARDLATRAGAVGARNLAEASMALHSVLIGNFKNAAVLVDGVLTACAGRRGIVQLALLARAVHAAHHGRRREMDRTLRELRLRQGDEQSMYDPLVHGLARAFCALLEEDRPRAGDELFRAQQAEETNPTIFPLSGRYGIRLLLRALAGEADWPDYEAITAVPVSRYRWDRLFTLFARAILEGRSGRGAEATASVTEAIRVSAPYPMGRNLGLRLVGEAAVTDGWGTPGDWLRSAEDYFYAAGVPAVASACRALLRSTGLRIAQRRNGINGIPQSLRSAGVTVREYEVLCLLADRLGNREIADRLHLSPRTVEGHISSLIAKTGLPNRLALSKLAATTITTQAVV